MNLMTLRACFVALAAFIGSAALGDSPVTYSTERDEETQEQHLVVESDGEILIGPAAAIVSVAEERDFNGDGVMDALVSTSGGGNCCPETYMFVTVSNGKVITSELDDGWAAYTVIEENGQLLVQQKMGEATYLYKFDGKEAVIVRTIPKLTAMKEIEGVGALYTGDVKQKTLSADIDMDGKADTITCAIWTRWGSLASCTLPLPGGKSQFLEYACDRIGVLKTTRNGYREIVCNNDTVIYFDGKAWRTKD
jgi:hypothetical protein